MDVLLIGKSMLSAFAGLPWYAWAAVLAIPALKAAMWLRAKWRGESGRGYRRWRRYR